MNRRTMVTAALLACVVLFASTAWAHGRGRGQGAGPPLPQSVTPPRVAPAANAADPFATIKAATETPVQDQARYRYQALMDPGDPFHNLDGSLWNQTWSGEWLAAHGKGRTFELTPWYTERTKAEAAKKAGRAPRAPSIMELAPAVNAVVISTRRRRGRSRCRRRQNMQQRGHHARHPEGG